MSTARRAISLLLVLPLFVLVGCDQAAGPTDTTPEEAADNQKAATGHNPVQPGPGPGPPNVVTPDVNEVPLGIEPDNSIALVTAVQDNNWRDFWNELAWDLGDDFDAEVAVWGVLVVDGEVEESFLTEAVVPDGAGPGEDVPGTPPSLIPTPDDWMPGTDWVQGEEFVPESTDQILPAVAPFFQGSVGRSTGGQAPFTKPLNDPRVIPAPQNWVVDGIWQEAPGAGVNADVKTKFLVIPVATEPPSGQQQGQWGSAGILVGFEEEAP